MNLESLSDEELLQQIDFGIIAEKLENDRHWQLLKEYFKREAAKQTKMLIEIPAENLHEIRERQMAIKMLQNPIKLVESYQEYGRICMDEAEENRPGLLEKALKAIKKRTAQLKGLEIGTFKT